MTKALFAEILGTFWLVLGGCGSAILAATVPDVGIGYAGVALAFGLTVMTGAYAFAAFSGAHFNPAVTVGLWAAGRFPASRIGPYIAAQVAGGILAASVLYLIASGGPSFDATAGFAANGFGNHSPGLYGITAAFTSETVFTAMFVVVILGSTDRRTPPGLAPIAIGLALTIIHLVTIHVTNTSVNPARSTATALFQGTWAIHQLWLFWLAPILGAVTGGLVYRTLFDHAAFVVQSKTDKP